MLVRRAVGEIVLDEFAVLADGEFVEEVGERARREEMMQRLCRFAGIGAATMGRVLGGERLDEDATAWRQRAVT